MSRIKWILLLLLAVPLWADFEEQPPALALPEPQELIVNNRILAKINGKTISVMDVMKKMDVFLSQHYPQYINSKVARFQFYNAQWRNVLGQLIENELILSDSEGIDLKISDGDVREDLMRRFGPNVVLNLEKIGLTYEEARDMIYAELVVQKMQWFRVNSKAILSINPQDIKAAYKEFCQKNPAADEWKYQVLSIRGKNSEQTSEIVSRAQSLLTSAEASLESVYETLKGQENLDPSLSVTLTPVNEMNGKQLSSAHKAVLTTLTPGTVSQAIQQSSRDGTSAFRFFYLKEHVKKELPPFEKVSDRLNDELVEKAIEKETANYLAKLRRKFSFEEKSLPSDFQPFLLQ